METSRNFFAPAGKAALVTGGTSGLGYAIAKAFLQNGIDVAVCGGHPEKAQGLAELAAAAGRKYIGVRCDVTKADDVDILLAEAEAAIGQVRLLVNCAGMNILKPAEDYDGESFDRVMELNVKATHLVCKAAANRWMIPARGGCIVNISSVKSFLGVSSDYIAYCASKAAVNMYTKQLACEWAKYGIRVNAIAPTFVRTPINTHQLDDPAFTGKLLRRIPLGRIGKPEDVAAAALFLCSEGASFITGQILGVDGGLTAMQ